LTSELSPDLTLRICIPREQAFELGETEGDGVLLRLQHRGRGTRALEKGKGGLS
jgi:hypothetical protein